MSIQITTSFLPHIDADASLAFYRDALGFELRLDVGEGRMRWLTLGAPGQDDTSIVLEPPALDPNLSDEEKAVVAGLIAKGAWARILLTSDDVEGVLERARAAGAEIVQEVVEQPWGARDCAFRDPAQNLIRVQQG